MHVKSAQSLAHHSSREWLDLARNPAIYKRRKIKSHDLAADVPPGWTRELSIFRLIRDVAGIPFDARCIMVSSKNIDPIEGENSAIIEVEAEFSVGGRLLLLPDDENPDWQLFRFRSPATSDNLVEYLNKGAVMETLCHPELLRLDLVTLGQWEI
ncbi:hypothetical protein M407DRAFT_32140 [Tulasnella calospora MUT 4182]|uniref:Uncharacterized protein n=1 Tax=Tulasnella calospora MUT 4182 TaxID=1051891 RepID=A0A0C3Q5B7_9AGAM|nr:hypothetical protein M407DRAFT_32140 [Tulasnella calospora MUT 4182]